MRQFQAKIIKKSTIQLADAAEHRGSGHQALLTVGWPKTASTFEWNGVQSDHVTGTKLPWYLQDVFHDSVHRNSHKETPYETTSFYPKDHWTLKTGYFEEIPPLRHTGL